MMKDDAATNTTTVVTGLIPILDTHASILFDTRATHSFTSSSFSKSLRTHQNKMNHWFTTTLPSGAIMISTHWLKVVPVRISNREPYVDLVVFDMHDYDVIFSMDFLWKYIAFVECKKHRVLFNPKGDEQFKFIGESTKQPKILLSSMEAYKLLAMGCVGYLANVVDKSKHEDIKIEDIPIAREFKEVFPEDLPGLPPDHEIEFEIDTGSISKAPYRMAPIELKELHKQLQKLLEKGFIRPSHSPSDAPVLFVKKNMDR